MHVRGCDMQFMHMLIHARFGSFLRSLMVCGGVAVEQNSGGDGMRLSFGLSGRQRRNTTNRATGAEINAEAGAETDVEAGAETDAEAGA